MLQRNLHHIRFYRFACFYNHVCIMLPSASNNLCLMNFYSIFTNMANSIVVRQGMKEGSTSYWKHLPPFLWLLRDVLVRMPSKNGEELTPTEYLKTEVLHGDSSKDSVRKALTQFFPSFDCETLPPPSVHANVMESVGTSGQNLNPMFNEGVDKLISFLYDNLKPKKVSNASGPACDGATLAALVKQVSKAVNDTHSTPALENTWEMVVESRCSTVKEKLLQQYHKSIKARYDEASKGAPIEQESPLEDVIPLEKVATLEQVPSHCVAKPAEKDPLTEEVASINQEPPPTKKVAPFRKAASVHQVPTTKKAPPFKKIPSSEKVVPTEKVASKVRVPPLEKPVPTEEVPPTEKVSPTKKVAKIAPIVQVAGCKCNISLMSIHENLWSKLKAKLKSELGPLLSSPVIECTLESVTKELENELVQYQLVTDPHTQMPVRKVVGGALLKVIEENREKSWIFCNKLFNDLYSPISERVQTAEAENKYTPENLAADIKRILQEYDARSIGPEKWKVRATMETTIEQNKQMFQIRLQEILKHAKQERKEQEMHESLQTLMKSRDQLSKQFDEFRKQQQEAEDRRRQESESEVKELKQQIEKQRKKQEEMFEKETERRLAAAEQLSKEKVKKELAEEKVKELKETIEKNEEHEAKRTAKADEEIEKMQNALAENKIKETTREAKAKQEMDDMREQIKKWQKKLQEQQEDEECRKADADKEIMQLENTIKEKKQTEAEEKAKNEKIMKEKAEELEKQQNLLEEMKAEHDCTVCQINEEKEEEKRLKELAKEETKNAEERLEKVKSENAQMEKKWKKEMAVKEGERQKLSEDKSLLNKAIDTFEEKFLPKVFRVNIRKGLGMSK